MNENKASLLRVERSKEFRNIGAAVLCASSLTNKSLQLCFIYLSMPGFKVYNKLVDVELDSNMVYI